MSDERGLEERFGKMGARVRVTVLPVPRNVRDFNGGTRVRFASQDVRFPVRVDVRRDRDGEYFDVRRRSDVDVQVIDVRPGDRHLLLLARERDPGPRGEASRDVKSKFLCGHDERAWFVAAIPEHARARNVQDAKDALKPAAVWAAMREHGVRPGDRDRRRTAAFVRQGEWFFIPRPRLTVATSLVLRDEPIRRGAGKPHRCQFLYRSGGQRVHVSPRYPNGLTDAQYGDLPQKERDARGWRQMVRDAHVFVKGAVRHPDHKTVWLPLWHEVVMNTETEARAMQHVAFLD